MVYIWNVCRLFMSAFKRTAPSDEAMRVAPIQRPTGPTTVAKQKTKTNHLGQFWDNSMHRRCTEQQSCFRKKQKVHQCLKTGCESPTPFEKRKPCVHTHSAIDMKVWHCDHWPSDRSVSLRLWICALLTWRIQLVSCEQAGSGSYTLSWHSSPRNAWTQLSAPNGSNQASSSGTPVELSIHKTSCQKGWTCNDQLRSMIFIKFYHYEILSNFIKYYEISSHPTRSHKFFFFILHLEDHAESCWFLVMSVIQQSRSALSAWQLTRRRRFDGEDDVTSLATRGRESNAAVVPKFLWSCSWCLFVVNDYINKLFMNIHELLEVISHCWKIMVVSVVSIIINGY